MVRWEGEEAPLTIVRGKDVPLGNGLAVRVAVVGGTLILAIGEGQGSGWRERPEVGGLSLPAHVGSRLVLGILEAMGEA